MIRTVYWENNKVVILDQSKLPSEVVYEKLSTADEVARAIKQLKVRGAPLIGVTAAFGLALAMKDYNGSIEEREKYFDEKAEILAKTRPTAVNLFWALEYMRDIFKQNYTLNNIDLAQVLMDAAGDMYEQDCRINMEIGQYGQDLLPGGTRIMTICNAGALATCGYGTALGVIRAAHERNKIDQVFACETRPVLQGARLTVWELMQDKIPVTLLTDNMAGYIMSLSRIDAVIAGADRIAANGDTANKIGTYSLAVLANYHHIPFYIAAPLSTIDYKIACGKHIPIEQRGRDEVLKVGQTYLSVPEVDVFNPAFDVTPAELITAIITEKGVIKPPFAQGLEKIRGKDHEI